MQVSVVRLRAKGVRLPRETILVSAPTSGHLNVHQRFDHWSRRDVYVATLTLGDFASTEQLLPTLDKVRIGKLSGAQFVLFGEEDLSHRKVTALYSQGWWCRLA